MKKRIIILISTVIIIVLLANIYYYCLFRNGIVISCLFHDITGFYCPGCGVTRMIISFVKFDLYQAFRYNQLIFIALPFIMICLIDFIFKWINNNQNYLYRKISDKVWIVLLCITLLFGLLRNIPLFDYLIPTLV